MEQVLLDKMREGTCDFVDKAMITSRVMKVVKDVIALCSTFTEGIEKIQKENGDEMKMAGIAVVFGLSTLMDEVADEKCSAAAIIGSKERVDKLSGVLGEMINE